jgi:hypothetical protein
MKINHLKKRIITQDITNLFLNNSFSIILKTESFNEINSEKIIKKPLTKYIFKLQTFLEFFKIKKIKFPSVFILYKEKKYLNDQIKDFSTKKIILLKFYNYIFKKYKKNIKLIISPKKFIKKFNTFVTIKLIFFKNLIKNN